MTVFRNHYQHRRQHPSLTGSFPPGTPTRPVHQPQLESSTPLPSSAGQPQVFKVFPNRLVELPTANSVNSSPVSSPHRSSNLSHRVVYTNGTLAMIVPGSAGGDSWRDLAGGGHSPTAGES
jgi:hypothetical protein